MRESFCLSALCVVFGVLIISQTAPAGELHAWVDDQGVTHITDTPPPPKKTTKVIGSTSYREATSQEKLRLEAEQARDRLRYKTEAQALREGREATERREDVRARISEKERELQETIRRGTPGDSRDLQKWALEAAAKKGEINNLRQQDPDYRPDPNAALKQRIEDLEFNVRQKEIEYDFDKIRKGY